MVSKQKNKYNNTSMATQYLTGTFQDLPLTLELGSEIDIKELIKVWESEIEEALCYEGRYDYIKFWENELSNIEMAWEYGDKLNFDSNLFVDWCKGIAILLKLEAIDTDTYENDGLVVVVK